MDVSTWWARGTQRSGVPQSRTDGGPSAGRRRPGHLAPDGVPATTPPWCR